MEIPTKAYVDSISENEPSRRDLFVVFKDQDNEFDIINLPKLDNITGNRNPNKDNEFSTKKYNVDK